MYLAKRSIAAALLASAFLLAGGGGLFVNPAQAFPYRGCALPPFPDGPVWGPQFARWPCDPAGNLPAPPVVWEPATYTRLQEVFDVEGNSFDPGDRRISWRLVTKKTFAGPVGLAETKVREALDEAYKKEVFCVFFYDAEGRKVGSGDVFLLIGERRADDRFAIFASVNTINTELIAVRGLITLCERAALPGLPKLNGEGKKPPL